MGEAFALQARVGGIKRHRLFAHVAVDFDPIADRCDVVESPDRERREHEVDVEREVLSDLAHRRTPSISNRPSAACAADCTIPWIAMIALARERNGLWNVSRHA